ncbi:MAG: metal-dependent hydrolase [Pseudomonadales bacterium]|nr:metal-dependent hydrolase [Pseudomonadales bacterium]
MSSNNTINVSKSVSNTDTDLVQRKVAFDFSDTPLHWIPNDPYSSHFISVIHTILPAGEFFFCRLYNRALPYIEDEKLREDVKGFIKQEAMHARAHTTGINEYLAAQGMEVQGFIKIVEWLFEQALDDKPFGKSLPAATEKQWLTLRLGLIAAVEHFTCVLGKYALSNKNWDAQGADATILDILRWHGAEEIEHRSVAFDVYQHLGGTYAMRFPMMLVAYLGVLGLWSKGASHLMLQDPKLKGKKPRLMGRYFWRTWNKKAKQGQLPSAGWLFSQATRYLKRDYDPVNEACTEEAQRYLETSPAALRALGFADSAAA